MPGEIEAPVAPVQETLGTRARINDRSRSGRDGDGDGCARDHLAYNPGMWKKAPTPTPPQPPRAGGGTEAPSSGASPSASAVRIMDEVSKIIDEGAFKLPLLPEVALNLSRVASRPNVDLREVEAAICRDPAVAAKVLSVANSAIYARGTTLNSLGGAILRLGLGQVRDLVYQVVAQNKIFRVPGYTERTRELFESAQAGALVAREISRILGQKSDLAYLCGLFHDMGESVILGIISELKRPKSEPIPKVPELAPIIDRYHAAIGAKVALAWKLPDSIADAILNHHHPEQSTDPSKMALLAAVADLALIHVGLGVPQEVIVPEDRPEFAALGLDAASQGQAILQFTELLMENPAAWAMSPA